MESTLIGHSSTVYIFPIFINTLHIDIYFFPILYSISFFSPRNCKFDITITKSKFYNVTDYILQYNLNTIYIFPLLYLFSILTSSQGYTQDNYYLNKFIQSENSSYWTSFHTIYFPILNPIFLSYIKYLYIYTRDNYNLNKILQR